jgi:hypothetical protein
MRRGRGDVWFPVAMDSWLRGGARRARFFMDVRGIRNVVL